MQSMSLNSQSIILLTAYFNKGDKPLTISEYSKFATWLMSKNMSPADLLEPNSEDILSKWQDNKITTDRILQLLNRGNAMAIALQKWENAGIWIMTRADPEYPKRLKKQLGQKAPPILYGAGNKKILNTKGVAIIGSRDITENDMNFAFKLGEKLALSGYSVVSGGARGVDESSMLGSIHADGTTIGVVADDLIQKVLSKKYRDAIMNNSLVLISPFYPEARFNVGNAMGRNKYIYTLAESSVVVYSGLTGGTWEGAKEDLSHQWVPLFVKGNDDKKSGNTKLIEMGGKLLPDSFLDQVEIDFLFKTIVSVPAKEQNIDNFGSMEDRVLDAFKGRKLTLKEIISEIDAEEKQVKKIVDELFKGGVLEKHQSRPLKFSRVSKLPGMDV